MESWHLWPHGSNLTLTVLLKSTRRIIHWPKVSTCRWTILVERIKIVLSCPLCHASPKNHLPKGLFTLSKFNALVLISIGSDQFLPVGHTHEGIDENLNVKFY